MLLADHSSEHAHRIAHLTTPSLIALPDPDRLRPAWALLWWAWGAAAVIAAVLVLGGLLVI